jgi:hypothetical protein
VTVRLTIVADESEAEVVCGLLRAEGIRCFHRGTDLTAHLMPSLASGGWREVLVNEDDLQRARELLKPARAAVDECTRCGRPLDEDGGWFRDEAGEIEPYCGVCAERLFGWEIE